MKPQIPKYSIIETEKKWLINQEKLPDLSKLKKFEIEDKYIPKTRLRLRKLRDLSKNETTFRICKKYGKISKISEPITNIYLTKKEFNLFNQAQGKTLTKNRYRYNFKKTLFYIDEIPLKNKKIYILETEISSERDFQKLQIPNFVIKDITKDEKFSGVNLSS